MWEYALSHPIPPPPLHAPIELKNLGFSFALIENNELQYTNYNVQIYEV